MSSQSTKQKGDLLEQIVEKLCAGFDNSKVQRDIKILGKSGTERQIDVLIEATQKSFDIKIVVEAKNYAEKVGIEKVDALKTKLMDVGANLGVIVCPLGFTKGAVDAASLHDIQLFQVFDNKLGNTDQLIPMRYIDPYIDGYSLRIEHSSSGGGTFSLPTDTRKWRFYVKDKILNQEEIVDYAWSNSLFPRTLGEHLVDFGVIKISTEENTQKFFYLEFKISILIKEDYYLKLFPVSFMKNIKSGKGNHNLFIDIYSKKEDMLKNGWRYFETKEEMESVAGPLDTSEDAKQLVMHSA